MLQFLLHRPIAVLMTFLGLLLLGLVVAWTLPISLLPQTAIPQITVQIKYPNIAASELENTVTRPLRLQLLQVGKLEDIQTRTRNSHAVMVLDFAYGTNINLAFIEVNEKIDQMMSSLPRDLERPQVIKSNISDLPVFYLSVVPKNPSLTKPLELSEFSQTILKRRLEQLPQIAFVDRSGFAEPMIKIKPYNTRMEVLGLREQDITRILENNTLYSGNVLVQDGQYQYQLRFSAAVQSEEDVANLYFNHQGRVLQIKDIAEVRLVARQARGSFLHHGQKAVVFAVRKQADAQVFALRTAVEELLEVFKKDYPQLDFYITNDQSALLKVSMDNLRTSLLYGIVFAFLVLWLFFREWRNSILVGIVIPVALILSLLGFYLLGLFINVISLSGLILGVGLMVDNSIIVIDNIKQQQQFGKNNIEAADHGANEVIRPLISSALTTCSVFLPLIFLSGIAGALFYDQALSISIALGASVLVAYFLLPILFNLLSKTNVTSDASKSADSGGIYTALIDQALRFRGWTLLIFISFSCLMFFPLKKLSIQSFPNLSSTAISMEIDWNEAISITENEQRVLTLLATFQDKVEQSTSFLGEQQFLLEKEAQHINEAFLIWESTMELEELIHQLNTYFAKNHPQAIVKAQVLKNVFDEIFNPKNAGLIAHIQTLKANELPNETNIHPVINYLKQEQIDFVYPAKETQILIAVEAEKALLYDVPRQNILQRLQTLFNQNNIGQLQHTQQYVPIVLGTSEQSFVELIQDAFVSNRQGKAVPLSTFIRWKKEEGYKTLTGGKAGLAYQVGLKNYNEKHHQQLADILATSPDVSVYFTGQYFENQKNIKELSVVLGIALVLLYLILAAQFESLLLPLIVLMTVPVGISGALWLLYLSGQSLNLVAMTGLIVMSGIIVNDAILKIDMMNKLKKTMPLRAAIHQAGRRRLKPIVLTSLTTILALLPILFSTGLGADLQRPLALAVIGGLVLGTTASLWFIPVLYKIVKGNTTV